MKMLYHLISRNFDMCPPTSLLPHFFHILDSIKVCKGREGDRKRRGSKRWREEEAGGEEGKRKGKRDKRGREDTFRGRDSRIETKGGVKEEQGRRKEEEGRLILSGQPKLEHREQRLDHRGSFFPSETPNRRIFQEKFVKNFVPKFNSRFSVLVDFLGKSFDPQGTSSSLQPPLPPLPPSFISPSYLYPSSSVCWLPLLPPLLFTLAPNFRALPFLLLLFLLLSTFPSPAFQLIFGHFPNFPLF
jgi:hypothetical protein